MGLKVGPITPSLGEPTMRASSSTAPGSAAISSALPPEGPEGPEAPEGPDCADGPKGEASDTDLKSGDLFNKSGDLNMDRSR